MIRIFSNFTAAFFSKVFRRTRPIIVHLNVTNRCNLTCSFCYNKLNHEAEMSLENYKKIIDNLSDAGTVKVTLIGGEPFLRKDISSLVQYAKERIRYVFLTTNGLFSIVDNRKAIETLDGISFSINEAFVLGYWQELSENIKRVQQLNDTVSISCILTRSNSDNLNHILTFAKSNNIGIYFTPAINSLHPMEHNVRDKIQRIIKAKRDGYPVINSITYLSGLNKKNLHKKCYAGRMFFAVNTNADLYPCLNFIGQKRFAVGNILHPQFRFDTIRFASNCIQCNWNCHEEANYLLSFHPEAILNLLKSSYGRKSLF